MKKLHYSITAIIVSVCLFGCSNVPIQGVSPVSTTGQDLNSLAAQATQAYVDYKAGRVDYAWAVSHMLTAYQTIAKTSGDVRSLVKQWSGDGTFAERMARVFAASTAPPEVKMKALAAGVTISAANTGP